MNNNSRKLNDYKIGEMYYYVKVYTMIPQYVDFYKIRLIDWEESFTSIQGNFEIIDVLIGNKMIEDRDMKLSLGWITPTFKEGIKEIIDSEIDRKIVIRSVFR